MTTYTATAAPDGAAVTTDADRNDAGLRACLRILFLVSAHNSLSQRVRTELTDLGHEVAVAVVATAEETEAAVAAHSPELIVCPMLKTMIPEQVWARRGAADAATQLRTAVKDYERHVLAWYALGRSADAKAARDMIERRRRATSSP